MFIKIPRDHKKIWEKNRGLYSVPEFSVLNPSQMVVVALVADYKSPFRNYEERKRRREAMAAAGYSVTCMEKGREVLNKTAQEVVRKLNPKLEAAIKKYMELQRDIDMEILVAYDIQLKQFRDFLMKPEKDRRELEMAMKIQKELLDLTKKRRSLMEALNLEPEDIKELASQEAQKLSTLERENMEKIAANNES